MVAFKSKESELCEMISAKGFLFGLLALFRLS